MASPKMPKLMMHSTPGRPMRSPGLHRRTKLTDEDAVAAKLSKKSRRSRSSDQCSSRDPDTPGLARKNASKEDQSEDSSSASQATASHSVHRSAEERWKIMLKSIEKMSREEIMSNFRLLMSDHLKLEKFLSFITRENDATRNRLESDLLDAMMNIEELKQALEVRAARRSRVDPREAEERRSLIRQNKKLLKQLYDSAKKIDKLELTIREGQEQLELMEFQMLESENLTKSIEDGLISFDSLKDLFSGSCSSEPPSEDKMKYLEEMVDKLRQENEELREQSFSFEELEHSLDDNEKLNQMKTVLQEKDQIHKDLKAQLQVYAERCQRLEAALRTQQACAAPQTSRAEPVASQSHSSRETATNSFDSAFFESSGNNFSFIESGFEDSEAESDSSKQLTPTRPRSPQGAYSRYHQHHPPNRGGGMAAESQATNPEPQEAMVPLENKEIVKEVVPDHMKPKEADTLVQATVRHFQTLLNDREREIEELKSKVTSLEKQIDEISNIPASTGDETTANDLQQTLLALEVQVKQLKSDNEELRETGSNNEKTFNERYEKIQRDNEELIDQLKERDMKIAALDNETDKSKQEIEASEFEIKRLTEELTEKSAVSSDIQSEFQKTIDELNKENLSLKELIDSKDVECEAKLTVLSNENELALSVIQEEKSRLERELEFCQSSLTSQESSVNDFTAMRRDYESNESALKKEIVELKSSHKTDQDNIEILQAKCDKLAQSVSTREEEMDALSRSIRNKDNEIESLKQEIHAMTSASQDEKGSDLLERYRQESALLTGDLREKIDRQEKELKKKFEEVQDLSFKYDTVMTKFGLDGDDGVDSSLPSNPVLNLISCAHKVVSNNLDPSQDETRESLASLLMNFHHLSSSLSRGGGVTTCSDDVTSGDNYSEKVTDMNMDDLSRNLLTHKSQIFQQVIDRDAYGGAIDTDLLSRIIVNCEVSDALAAGLRLSEHDMEARRLTLMKKSPTELVNIVKELQLLTLSRKRLLLKSKNALVSELVALKEARGVLLGAGRSNATELEDDSSHRNLEEVVEQILLWRDELAVAALTVELQGSEKQNLTKQLHIQLQVEAVYTPEMKRSTAPPDNSKITKSDLLKRIADLRQKSVANMIQTLTLETAGRHRLVDFVLSVESMKQILWSSTVDHNALEKFHDSLNLMCDSDLVAKMIHLKRNVRHHIDSIYSSSLSTDQFLINLLLDRYVYPKLNESYIHLLDKALPDLPEDRLMFWMNIFDALDFESSLFTNEMRQKILPESDIMVPPQLRLYSVKEVHRVGMAFEFCECQLRSESRGLLEQKLNNIERAAELLNIPMSTSFNYDRLSCTDLINRLIQSKQMLIKNLFQDDFLTKSHDALYHEVLAIKSALQAVIILAPENPQFSLDVEELLLAEPNFIFMWVHFVAKWIRLCGGTDHISCLSDFELENALARLTKISRLANGFNPKYIDDNEIFSKSHLSKEKKLDALKALKVEVLTRLSCFPSVEAVFKGDNIEQEVKTLNDVADITRPHASTSFFSKLGQKSEQQGSNDVLFLKQNALSSVLTSYSAVGSDAQKVHKVELVENLMKLKHAACIADGMSVTTSSLDVLQDALHKRSIMDLEFELFETKMILAHDFKGGLKCSLPRKELIEEVLTIERVTSALKGESLSTRERTLKYIVNPMSKAELLESIEKLRAFADSSLSQFGKSEFECKDEILTLEAAMCSLNNQPFAPAYWESLDKKLAPLPLPVLRQRLNYLKKRLAERLELPAAPQFNSLSHINENAVLERKLSQLIEDVYKALHKPEMRPLFTVEEARQVYKEVTQLLETLEMKPLISDEGEGQSSSDHQQLLKFSVNNLSEMRRNLLQKRAEISLSKDALREACRATRQLADNLHAFSPLNRSASETTEIDSYHLVENSDSVTLPHLVEELGMQTSRLITSPAITEALRLMDFQRDKSAFLQDFLNAKNKPELIELVLDLESRQAERDGSNFHPSDIKEARIWLQDKSKNDLINDAITLLKKEKKELFHAVEMSPANLSSLEKTQLVNLVTTLQSEAIKSSDKMFTMKPPPADSADKFSDGLDFDIYSDQRTPAEKKIENLLNKVDRLERENERWRALVERMNRNEKDSSPDLLATKDSLKQSQSRESTLRGQLDSALQEIQALQAKLGGVDDSDERNPRYFSLQLQEVRHEHQLEELQTKLAYSDRRRQEAERNNSELTDEIAEKKRSNESLEVALLAAKKMEATLKRRIDALELKKSGSSGDNSVKVAQLEAKVAQLESINSSLSESCKVERARLHEQTVRIRQLESDQRNMTDRLQDLQSREMCGQKKVLRLQAIYEDMLREYAEVKTHDVSWRKRAKGYENLEEDLKHKVEDYENSMKVLHREKVSLDSQVCQAREEVKSLKEALQAMQKKAEQREQTYQETIDLVDTYQLKLTQTNQKLSEAQAKLKELEKVSASKSLTPQRGNGNERRPSNPNTPESARRGQSSRPADYEQRLNDANENERKQRLKIRQLEDSEQKLQTKILQLEAKIASLNRKGEVSESVNALQAALIQRERDLADSRREIKNLKDEVDEAKALYENRTAEVTRLRTKVNSLENQINDQTSNSFYPPPGYSLIKDKDQV